MPADFKSHFFQALLNAWGLIRMLAPYLVGGIALAAVLNTFLPLDRPAKALRAAGWRALPLAGLVGMVSPACTYGTVPIFAQMARRGAPIAPAAVFLVASALVNPQMFVLTLGALGAWVAIAQAVAALVFAVGIGAIVTACERRGIRVASADVAVTEEAAKHGAPKRLPWPRRLGSSLLDLTEFIGFYFVVGTLIAALVSEFVPAWIVADWVGEGRWWAVPFAAVLSIPTYVCGGGTIPLLAQAREMGMSTGAILAFLIAGPATRVTALVALAALFRKRAVAVYVVLLIAFAILLGAALAPLIPVRSQPMLL